MSECFKYRSTDADADSIGDACDDDPDDDGTNNLEFNFVPSTPADSVYGQDSISFTSASGNFTLTVTGSLMVLQLK